MKALRAAACVGLLATAVAGCAAPPPEDGLVADPIEGFNRTMHSFNKGLDTVVLQPATDVYVTVTPTLFRHLFGNAISHLSLPGVFLNQLLQGEATAAIETFGRFAVNTIVGAGVLDPATEAGLPAARTDFGLTLASWGVDEGIYVELPVFGPSTARDTFGRIVDTALQPTTYISGGVEVQIASATVRALEIVEARDRNAALIDDLLYRSEDSYVSLRANYIQNRRRRASGGKTDVDALPDLFED